MIHLGYRHNFKNICCIPYRAEVDFASDQGSVAGDAATHISGAGMRQNGLTSIAQCK